VAVALHWFNETTFDMKTGKHSRLSAERLVSESRLAQQNGDFTAMLDLAERAHTLAPDSEDAALRLAECHLFCGQADAAVTILNTLEDPARNNPQLLQRIAELYTQCSQFPLARRCHQRSVDLQPANPGFIYNLAASCIALGDLDQAERLFNEVIRLDPRDYDAWQNRSTLRRQTPEANHVEPLLSVLAQLGENDPGRAQIGYALAKELEDLQRYDESFRCLQEGAVARRIRLDYDVGRDISSMERIAETFTSELMQSAPPIAHAGRPVFVLGLPRSGTTLVDRIISSHSQAASLGEINSLVFALMRTVGDSAASRAVTSRSDLISQSARIDFAVLGERYVQAIAAYGHQQERLVDKTPLNFLYLGLIRMAMPQARIIHLRRHPVDSCYAMYKTLFRMGYPFSYSLQDVGRYYIAYHQLMAHWRDVAPGSFLDVDYETLVADQEAESRRIMDWCGLEWEPACLEFHRSTTPAATASAAQVRQPIYSTSVGKWRCYEKQLAPFVARLREHGIEVD
jgi:tetratricopeptide (TPR) repeat protein